jgi:hypothetical protein
MSSTSNFPFVFRVVDLIPASASGETAGNSEPSIGVNPVNPMQMYAGTGISVEPVKSVGHPTRPFGWTGDR